MEIVVSDKISKELLGVFYNSFYLTNYEFSKKTKRPEENDKKDDGKEKDPDEEDPRTKVVTKKIDKFDITSNDHSFKENQDYKFWEIASRSTELARNLANTRGTEADPEYMEQ